MSKSLMFVRKVDLEKEPQLKQWIEDGKDKNAFDPKVLGYPCTETYAVHTNGTTHAVMPIQPVVMLESIGINPEASPSQAASAMMELLKAVALLAQRAGSRELYFLASDDGTSDGAERLGFVKVPASVYRMRLYSGEENAGKP